MGALFKLLEKFTKSKAHESLTIEGDGQLVTGNKGYRTALAYSSREHKLMYYEANVENDMGWARIGLATKKCDLNGPVGMDDKGYSLGNKNGYGFHKGKRVVFAERFGKGNIVSVYLNKFKDKSIVEFYVNGVKASRSFEVDGKKALWPAVSVYQGCAVKANFGPFFAYYDKIVKNPQKSIPGHSASSEENSASENKKAAKINRKIKNKKNIKKKKNSKSKNNPEDDLQTESVNASEIRDDKSLSE
jgi:SPRY domain